MEAIIDTPIDYPSTEPTYGSGTRMVHMYHLLQGSKYGISRDSLADTLGVRPNTIRRYVKALRDVLVNEDGQPLVVIDVFDRVRVLGEK